MDGWAPVATKRVPTRVPVATRNAGAEEPSDACSGRQCPGTSSNLSPKERLHLQEPRQPANGNRTQDHDTPGTGKRCNSGLPTSPGAGCGAFTPHLTACQRTSRDERLRSGRLVLKEKVSRGECHFAVLMFNMGNLLGNALHSRSEGGTTAISPRQRAPRSPCSYCPWPARERREQGAAPDEDWGEGHVSLRRPRSRTDEAAAMPLSRPHSPPGTRDAGHPWGGKAPRSGRKRPPQGPLSSSHGTEQQLPMATASSSEGPWSGTKQAAPRQGHSSRPQATQGQLHTGQSANWRANADRVGEGRAGLLGGELLWNTGRNGRDTAHVEVQSLSWED
ncbi:uncharacterized protein LOC125616995 [Marmota marmota marmota]|uniref:uncharacterized protein LOC125616995 n=1 Tax=Marmota marmota marmota TaxID=9994 RepID=UPI002093ED42|nr:uncharacterized protein LOC125616995 [Marmota marmota marmota]XP_048659740.1 uncharacterized protein LOC125616995 [Marmota marmota marmota]